MSQGHAGAVPQLAFDCIELDTDFPPCLAAQARGLARPPKLRPKDLSLVVVKLSSSKQIRCASCEREYEVHKREGEGTQASGPAGGSLAFTVCVVELLYLSQDTNHTHAMCCGLRKKDGSRWACR